MPQLFRAELLMPIEMTPPERRRYEDEIYALLSQIFACSDEGLARRGLFGDDAEHAWIQLYRGPQGELAGYCALKIVERQMDGRDIAVLRGQVGILREYRGGRLVPAFGIPRVLRYILAHPGKPLYFYGFVVSPASYAQLWEYAARIWPCPEEDTPPPMAALMKELTLALGAEIIAEQGALVCRCHLAARDSAAERERWISSAHPGARFFLAANPNYVQGLALVTLIPVTLGGVLRSAARYVKARARKRARSMRKQNP